MSMLDSRAAAALALAAAPLAGCSSGSSSGGGTAPSNRSSSTQAAFDTVGVAIVPSAPTVTGDLNGWTIAPAPPRGLSFETSAGVVGGPPASAVLPRSTW